MKSYIIKVQGIDGHIQTLMIREGAFLSLAPGQKIVHSEQESELPRPVEYEAHYDVHKQTVTLSPEHAIALTTVFVPHATPPVEMAQEAFVPSDAVVPESPKIDSALPAKETADTLVTVVEPTRVDIDYGATTAFTAVVEHPLVEQEGRLDEERRSNTASNNEKEYWQQPSIIQSKQELPAQGGLPDKINQPPVNIVPEEQVIELGNPLIFSHDNGNAIAITDPDAGEGELRITLTAQKGVLTLSQFDGLTFVDGDGTQDAEMEFTGTLASINAALNGLEFLGDNEGKGSVRITTNDQGNAGIGGARMDVDKVDIDIIEGGEQGLFLVDDGDDGVLFVDDHDMDLLSASEEGWSNGNKIAADNVADPLGGVHQDLYVDPEDSLFNS